MDVLANFKYRKRLPVVHHLLTVAEIAGVIVAGLCEANACPRRSPADAVLEAMVLGVLHDYAKEPGRSVALRLARALAAEARRLGATESGAGRLQEIIKRAGEAAATAETGAAWLADRSVSQVVIDSVTVADYLASQDTLAEAINGLPVLFAEKPVPSSASTYDTAAANLRSRGARFSYIILPEHRPHAMLIAVTSVSIASLTNAVYLASYPDGLLLFFPPGREPQRIKVSSIAQVIASRVEKRPTPKEALPRFNSYMKNGIVLARLVVAVALLRKGVEPEEILKTLYPRLAPGSSEYKKKLEALKALRDCLRSGKCSKITNKINSIAGGNLGHGSRYIESLQNYLLVDDKTVRENLLLKIVDLVKSDYTVFISKHSVDPDLVATATLLLAFSKDTGKLGALAAELGVPKPKGKDILGRALWALETAERVTLDDVVNAILRKRAEGLETGVERLALKLAKTLMSPLIEDDVEEEERPGGATYRCMLCGFEVSRSESRSLKELKTILKSSGGFASVESWVNAFPAYSNVDTYINTDSNRICNLCLYEVTNGLFPPMLRIVLGPPIGISFMLSLSAKLVSDGLASEIYADLFSASLLIRLVEAGRYRGSLQLAGKTVFDTSDGNIVGSIVSRIAYTRIAPLYMAAPVYEVTLGGEPEIVTSQDGSSTGPSIEGVNVLAGLRGERDDRPLAPYKILLYYAASRALREWSRAASQCRRAGAVRDARRPFPSGNKGGLVLDLYERITTYYGGGDRLRVVFPFSLAVLAAHKAGPQQCGDALRRAVRTASWTLARAPWLERLLAGVAPRIREVGLEVSELSQKLQWYAKLMIQIVPRRGIRPGDASPHEVSSLLKGIDDAIQHYAKRQDVDEAVDLAVAKALQRLKQVYKCDPEKSDPCRQVLFAVRDIAREIIGDIANGRIHLGEVGRLLKDIYHLAYYYYVFSLLRGKSPSK